MATIQASRGGDGAIEIGIRPEHVVLDPRGIDVVEPLGGETLVTTRLGAAPLVARLPGDVLPSPGEVLKVALPADRLIYLAPSTGLRVR